jgi:hypothetical protein
MLATPAGQVDLRCAWLEHIDLGTDGPAPRRPYRAARVAAAVDGPAAAMFGLMALPAAVSPFPPAQDTVGGNALHQWPPKRSSRQL